MADAQGVLPENFQSVLDGSEKAPCPAAISEASSLNEILLFAREAKASDVHLSSGAPIMFRKFTALVVAAEGRLNGEKIGKILQDAIPQEKWEEASGRGDLEFIYSIPGGGRFRMVITRQRHGWDMTARLIDMKIRTFEESGMPASCQGLTRWAQGLVLVAGPAGCGKTSTLATLINLINQTRDEHIITIESPIEVVYTPQKSQISQRGINIHTLSAANALRAALREDPNIIVVSELRDLEMIQLAVSAAETGHLVFGTMNTNDASQTITSLINSFSPDEQPIVRNMVSESLRGVVCQQLIPRKDGQGVVPAFEVLTLNSAVAALIKTGRSRQLNNVISTGKSSGMVLLDFSMMELVKKDIITGQEALRRAIDPRMFAEYAAKAPVTVPEGSPHA
ncbi:MAG: PilT/PilU family type 4a pilus ATPase [Candidatus Omnitrophota bacterium]